MVQFAFALTLLAVNTKPVSPIQTPAPDISSIRKELNEQYKNWRTVRLNYDRPAMESILSPDFYAVLPDKRLTRKEFIDAIATKSDRVTLLRFDSHILTVTPKDGAWITVITEKLEVTFTDKTGKKRRGSSYWVTRDGWRKENGQWHAFFTESIGNENWRDVKPPFSDWDSHDR